MRGKNILLVLAGPSGVGKGTLCREILKTGRFSLSVSCTTRPPREGEREGESYFFLKREEFLSRIQKGDFLEYDEHFGNFYGTPKSFVEEKLLGGDVLLEIDVVGALTVKKNYPKALLVFVEPPSIEELKRRIYGRGSESEEKIEERLSRAAFELKKREEFDYSVVNDNLSVAAREIINIVNRERG